MTPARMLAWAALAGLLLAVLVVLKGLHGVNGDAAMFLVMAQRLADGGRLYVDVVEFNPPPVYWLAEAVVHLSRALGLPASTVFDGVVATLALGSAALVAWLQPARPGLALLVLVLLGPLAVRHFGQREHLLMIAILPLLVLCLPGARAGRAPALALGVLAGLGVALKPYFLLLPLLLGMEAALRGAWRRTDLRWAACGLAGTVAAVAASVPLFYPEYLATIVPFALAVYVADWGRPLWLALRPWLAGLVLLQALAALPLGRHGPARAALGPLLAVALGAALSAILQARGFDYHLYPLAVAGVLLGLAAWRQAHAPGIAQAPRLATLAGAVLLVLACGQQLVGQSLRPYPSRAEAVALEAAIAGEIAAHAWRGPIRIGALTVFAPVFTVAADLDLRWSGRHMSLWPMFARYQRGQRPTADDAILNQVVADLDAARPELILVERSWPGGPIVDYLSDMAIIPGLPGLLARYAVARDVGRFRLMARCAGPCPMADGAP
ncbi:hypothetical protein [Zavarzinia sp. CC-PAN008]|uniref:hypothetical protein n=1 Tax=Zavarzinia sp. CC-PAN008 TaxID=3243332 RepID=UPI003F74745A